MPEARIDGNMFSAKNTHANNIYIVYSIESDGFSDFDIPETLKSYYRIWKF